MGCQEVDGEREEERMRLKKMGFHELLYTEVVKCGTIIRLTSGWLIYTFLCIFYLAYFYEYVKVSAKIFLFIIFRFAPESSFTWNGFPLCLTIHKE